MFRLRSSGVSKIGRELVCWFIQLVKGLGAVQDGTCYVNIGYQSIYRRMLNSNLKLW